MAENAPPEGAAVEELPATTQDAPEAAEQPKQAPEADPDAPPEDNDGDEDEGLTEKKPRGKGAQARIAELTRLRHEAERERDFYKGLADQSAPNSPDGAEVEPQPEDFDDYGAYVKALAKHEVRQSQVASATQRGQIIREAAWESKLEAVKASIPDYDKVVGSSESPVAGHVADALMDSDRGPELAYHMASHPELLDRLNRMSPVKAAIELGKLETSLTAPVVKPASKAPPPATPIRTSGSTVPVDLAKADMETYREMRRKQRAA